ncbi:hypothetical protein DB30_06779 [Enhygromyxa salina]|uniref:Uncharacterized protein n=1 Tax=Enhygromyxa salina TaxID=215803 RepID=A0A0C2CTE3_9BACT|nr:hypothetical protein DB30_06779 [Enhygromyxa salina]
MDNQDAGFPHRRAAYHATHSGPGLQLRQPHARAPSGEGHPRPDLRAWCMRGGSALAHAADASTPARGAEYDAGDGRRNCAIPGSQGS